MRDQRSTPRRVVTRARRGWVMCPERGQGGGRRAPARRHLPAGRSALTGFPLPQMADCGGLPQISQVSPARHRSPGRRVGDSVTCCPLVPRLLPVPRLTVASDCTVDTSPFIKGAWPAGLTCKENRDPWGLEDSGRHRGEGLWLRGQGSRWAWPQRPRASAGVQGPERGGRQEANPERVRMYVCV